MADKITPLGGGEVGLDNELQGDAQMLQTEVSRNNYRATTSGDIQQFKAVVYRMVSKWAREDMLRIIQEYGDYHFIAGNKKVSDEQLKQQVVETLVIRLSKKDLKQILNQQNSETARVMTDIKKSNTNAARRAKRYFNLNTFAATYENIKYASNNKIFMRGIKAQEKSFKVPRGTVRLYPSLRKELYIILKGYDKISLVQQALSMGIDFPEGSSEKTVIDMIINKCVLYVSLILGKSKGGLGNVAIDSVRGIEELLSLTSFAYVTGSPGLSSAEIRRKRELVKAAKAKMTAQQKIQAETKGGKITAVRRALTKNNYNSAEKWQEAAAKQKINGEFANIKNLKELKERAYEFGINADDPKYKKDTGKLVFDLNRAMSATRKSALKSLLTGDETTAEELFSRFDTTKKQREKALTLESDKIPIVQFDDSGNIVSAKIVKAVPVVIVGNQTPGAREGAVAEIQSKWKYGSGISEESDIQWGNISRLLSTSASEDVVKEVLEKYQAIGKKPTKKLINKLERQIKKQTARRKKEVTNEEVKKLKEKFLREAGVVSSQTENTVDTNTSLETEQKKDVVISEPTTNKSVEVKETTSTQKIFGPVQIGDIKAEPTSPLHQKRKSHWDSLTDEQKKQQLEKMRKGKESSTKEHKPINFKKQFSKPITKAHYKDIMPVHEITPVYVANDGIDKIADLYKAVIDSRGDVSDIKSWISTNLPILFGGLQMGGTAFNAASAAASMVGMSASIQQAIIDAVESKISGLATGGSGRAMKRFASGVTASGYMNSSFITGDSLNGKPNEEMVNIDWNNKTFSVKPVNRDTGAADGISNLTRMNTAERSGPMQVSLSSGLVRYNKAISGASDDGSGTALKVYAINGLNESIVVNGEEVNPISLIAGIYTKLTSLETLTATNAQLLTSIATNTAQTASNTVPKNTEPQSSFSGFPEGISLISKGY